MKIHVNSKHRIKKLSEELLRCLCPLSIGSNQIKKNGYKVPVITLSEESEPLVINTEISGISYPRAFIDNNKVIGLKNDDITKIDIIVEELYKNKDIKNYISVSTLRTLIFRWMILKYGNESVSSLSTYVENQYGTLIGNYTIFFPIKHSIGSIQFHFGNLSFMEMTDSLIRSFFYVTDVSTSTKDKQAIESKIEDMRKRFQGCLCASYTATGEKEKVFEMGFYYYSRALEFFRIFCTAAYDPRQSSSLYEYAENSMGKLCYICKETNNNKLIITECLERNIHEQVFDENFLKIINCRAGLIYSQTLEGKIYSSFSKEVVNCTSLYSKSLLKNEIPDKIIYMLASLESILLKDNTEPIANNIGERLAILIGRTLEEKKEIILIIKKIYILRSDFVHHGNYKFAEEINIVEKFMKYIFTFITWLIENISNFKTKKELMEYIENKKLS